MDQLEKERLANNVLTGLLALVEAERLVNINRPDVGTGSPESLRQYSLALVVETAELLQELDWRAWRVGKAIDRERVADEFADILAFLGILTMDVMAQAGLTEQDLAEAFTRKTDVNIARSQGKIAGYVNAAGGQ